jgi:hypothetical protein
MTSCWIFAIPEKMRLHGIRSVVFGGLCSVWIWKPLSESSGIFANDTAKSFLVAVKSSWMSRT